MNGRRLDHDKVKGGRTMAFQPGKAWAKPGSQRHPNGCASLMPSWGSHGVGGWLGSAPATGVAPSCRSSDTAGKAQIAGRFFCFVLVLAFLLISLMAAGAWARSEEPGVGESIGRYLTPDMLQSFFPGADRIGGTDGTP